MRRVDDDRDVKLPKYVKITGKRLLIWAGYPLAFAVGLGLGLGVSHLTGSLVPPAPSSESSCGDVVEQRNHALAYFSIAFLVLLAARVFIAWMFKMPRYFKTLSFAVFIPVAFSWLIVVILSGC